MKEKSCGAVVYKIEDNIIKYLLVYQVGSNNYSFPKGHVENNESEVETALREIKEETNLDVNLNTDFKETMTYLVKAKKVWKDVVCFLATPASDDLRPQESEIIDANWYTYEEALELLEYESAKEVLVKANKYIMDHTN